MNLLVYSVVITNSRFYFLIFVLEVINLVCNATGVDITHDPTGAGIMCSNWMMFSSTVPLLYSPQVAVSVFLGCILWNS